MTSELQLEELHLLRARLARLERRRRLPRRAVAVLLVALLVAVVPLATLAAGPFSDLNTGSVHNPNIQAIAAVGITTGCNPPENTEYCPNDLVTREQMASFLARTAGLGGNPPVANARTAQTATNAVNAHRLDDQPASAYQLAAQPIANAQNAAQLGGQPPSYYQPANQPIANATNAVNAQNAGNADTVGGYAASSLTRIAVTGGFLTYSAAPSDYTDVARVVLTVPGTAPQAVVVEGQFRALTSPSGGFVTLRVAQDGGGYSGYARYPYETTDASVGIMVSTRAVFIAQPGTHTYTLQLIATAVPQQLYFDELMLFATTHPFGPDGSAGTTVLP
jgi:hypothetical protein